MVDAVDVCVIGAGPSGLSIAAYLEDAGCESFLVLDAASGPGWHDSLLFDGVHLQTPPWKDLVPDVPSSDFSFYKYLRRAGLFDSYVLAQFDTAPRRLFRDYLVDVAHHLERRLRWGWEVGHLEVRGDDCVVARSGSSDVLHARRVVVATGTRAIMPGWVRPVSDRVWVAGEAGSPALGDWAAEYQHVTVVGGGQTGAECVLELSTSRTCAVRWVTRHPWFWSMDDGAGANAMFTQGYAEAFSALPVADRARINAVAKVTSDGISPDTLREVYRRSFERRSRPAAAQLELVVDTDVVSAAPDGRRILLGARPGGVGAADGDRAATRELSTSAVVVACGRQVRTPPVVGPSGGLVATSGVDVDVFGLQEKNLSLLGWRSQRALTDIGIKPVDLGLVSTS